MARYSHPSSAESSNTNGQLKTFAFFVLEKSFFFLTVQPSFPEMVRLIDQAPVCLSLEEVTLCSSLEVLTEVNDTNALIVGKPKVILG
jgi:hypothetical protein